MYISLLNYLKARHQLDIPLWFNKILESHGVDLIVVPGKLKELDFCTMQLFDYQTVLERANSAFLEPLNVSSGSYVNVIAVDKTTEKILGYAQFQEQPDSLYMSDLASISNSRSLKDLGVKIPLVGSILMTAATLLCAGENKKLNWTAAPDAAQFYDKLEAYGVQKGLEQEYFTSVITDVDNVIPPKSYYEKYFPELTHADTKLYNIMNAVKVLALASRRKRLFDELGGEKTVIPRYANAILIGENSDIKQHNKWFLKNTIVMQKQGDSLVAYWGERKEFSLFLPLKEKEINNIFALLQKDSKQQEEEEMLLARIISAYGCSIIGNNYDKEYHNKKVVFGRLKEIAANAAKKKAQEKNNKDSDKKSDITTPKSPSLSDHETE